MNRVSYQVWPSGNADGQRNNAWFRGGNARTDSALPSERDDDEPSSLRLPPTRAARPTRERGVFLADTSERKRRANASKLTLVLAVVAVTSALMVSAPSLVMDTAVAANHGLALIGATSVAPNFIASAKRH